MYTLKQEIETEINLQRLRGELAPKQPERTLIKCLCGSQYYQSLEDKFIYIDNDNKKYINCPYCSKQYYL